MVHPSDIVRQETKYLFQRLNYYRFTVLIRFTVTDQYENLSYEISPIRYGIGGHSEFVSIHSYSSLCISYCA